MIDFFGDIGGFIMAPLYYAISAVLVGWHNAVQRVFGPDARRGRGRCRSSA